MVYITLCISPYDGYFLFDLAFCKIVANDNIKYIETSLQWPYMLGKRGKLGQKNNFCWYILQDVINIFSNFYLHNVVFC